MYYPTPLPNFIKEIIIIVRFEHIEKKGQFTAIDISFIIMDKCDDWFK